MSDYSKDTLQIIADAKEFAADPKPSLDEMIEVVGLCAWKREADQTSYLHVGLNDAPSDSAMREIVVLDAVHSFLEMCKFQPGKVAARLNRSAARSA